MAMNETERLRCRHKPGRITLLFVGESAPAGGTFFYAENSTLYREMRAVFEATLPTAFSDPRSFLTTFEGLGCYLDDVCLEPVNDLPDPERKERRRHAEPAVARRIRDHAPLMVAAIGKTTAAPHVRRALVLADLERISVDAISFPNRPEHKEAFRRELGDLLRRARRNGVLRT